MISFEIAELMPLAQQALLSQTFMFGSEKRPALVLVRDRGIYMMSNSTTEHGVAYGKLPDGRRLDASTEELISIQSKVLGSGFGDFVKYIYLDWLDLEQAALLGNFDTLCVMLDGNDVLSVYLAIKIKSLSDASCQGELPKYAIDCTDLTNYGMHGRNHMTGFVYAAVRKDGKTETFSVQIDCDDGIPYQDVFGPIIDPIFKALYGREPISEDDDEKGYYEDLEAIDDIINEFEFNYVDDDGLLIKADNPITGCPELFDDLLVARQSPCIHWDGYYISGCGD